MHQELCDDLSETIKKMESGEYLASEANTKKFLIEKVLSWLNYAVDDPSKVVMEWPITVKSASKSSKDSINHVDYAVVDSENKPRVLIEAKAFDQKINAHLDQLDIYLKNISPNADVSDLPKAGIITNGKDWAVYLPKEDNPREFNLISPYCRFNVIDILNKPSEEERIKSLVNCSQLVNQSSQDLQNIQIKNEMSNKLKQWFKSFLCDDSFDFLDDSVFRCIVVDCCKLKPIKGTKWTAENKEQFAPEIKKALKAVLSDIKDAYYVEMLKSKSDAEIALTGPSSTTSHETTSKSADNAIIDDVSPEEPSKIKTTQLELDILAKLQSIYDKSGLPNKLYSSALNCEFDVKLKYNDTFHYITYLFNDGINTNLRDNWSIRYRGENNIKKGILGLPLDLNMKEDLECHKAIPPKYAETSVSKGEVGFINYLPSNVQIRISSLDDLDELNALIVYCFKKEIAFWESKNKK